MNFPAPSIPPKRKRRVDIVLDLEQGIQHHGSAATVKTESHTLLVHVDSVTRHLRLLIDLRAITEDIEELVRRLFNEMFRKTPHLVRLGLNLHIGREGHGRNLRQQGSAASRVSGKGAETSSKHRPPRRESNSDLLREKANEPIFGIRGAKNRSSSQTSLP